MRAGEAYGRASDRHSPEMGRLLAVAEEGGESMKRKLYITLPAASASFILLLFWLGGFDFNERGANAVFCALFAIFAAGAAVALVKLFTD